MATITTRIDDEIKQDLTKFSNEIGISVGSLFNARARNLLRTKEVTFKLDVDLKEIKRVKEMDLEVAEALKYGKSYSGGKDLIDDLLS
ncbi:type II toxin-antitoxin system RelB/DinJ family antitoxin [Chryseobacterium sp. EO14]|uniref:type II toxin-antitoxin system RelB/DinJ family antitoxin n=1 Tax=Chryseobacterium sp. EO14 TaxID=2950551 RepID=UPI00210995F7|nr:type II toxin-antitoxin system RelB/DinJ family antitoxin [Chryseobacterium sp. EO14]MCQ4141617.1 type II toxin-antitoxin system RelB/DinJ family antitoxin [Chryseobacterium sp. EO14]